MGLVAFSVRKRVCTVGSSGIKDSNVREKLRDTREVVG